MGVSLLKLYANSYRYSFHDHKEIKSLMSVVVSDSCGDEISSRHYAFTNNRTYYVDYNEFDNRIDIWVAIGRDQSIFAEYKLVKKYKIKLGLLKSENYNDYSDED